MEIIIESITEWERDEAEIAGDRSHGLSESDILQDLAEETKAKKEESTWTKGLPFTWEEKDVEFDVNSATDIGSEIDVLLADALSQYSDQYCYGDYLKPTEFEGRITA